MSLIQKFSCGDVIENRYHLDVQIHQGRWGDVYRATDQVEDRPVAIRFFPAGDDEPADFDRFSAHARELSGLSTPIIATPIDHGIADDIPFLVFRWAQGQNLEDRLAERGPLTLEQTLKILERILEGLARGHDSRMTHGLIRPVKIKVDDVDNDRPFVKIVDFQIWRFFEWTTGKDAFEESNLSRRIVRYTSPEVLDEHRVKPATDVYATGLLAIELLTGQPAFDDNHRVALIARQMSDEPAELSFDVDAGESFREFLAKMVAKDQGDRFFTAGKALKELKNKQKTFLSEPPAVEEQPEPEEPEEPEADEPEATVDESETSDPESTADDSLFELAEESAMLKQPEPSEPTKKQAPSTPELEQANEANQAPGDDESGEIVDDDVDFGDFYKRSSLDADDLGGESSSPLMLDEDSDPIGLADESSGGEGIPAAKGDNELAGSEKTSPKPGDASLITDSSVPVADDSALPSTHPSSPKSRMQRALEAKRKAKRNKTIGLVALVVLAAGGLIVFFQPDDSQASDEEPEMAELEEEAEEDVPVHLLHISTNPPAQRILIPGRTDRMMSPVDVEVAENEFPLKIRARFDSETIQEETIAGPTDEAIHFDFSDQ